jgi:hypothetical protein
MFLLVFLIALSAKEKLPKEKNFYKSELIDLLLLLGLFSIPYFYVFSILPGWLVILILSVYIMLMGQFLSTSKKK